MHLTADTYMKFSVTQGHVEVIQHMWHSVCSSTCSRCMNFRTNLEHLLNKYTELFKILMFQCTRESGAREIDQVKFVPKQCCTQQKGFIHTAPKQRKICFRHWHMYPEYIINCNITIRKENKGPMLKTYRLKGEGIG